jgi:hypothetical protein
MPEADAAAAGAGWTGDWPDAWQWPYGQQPYGWQQAYSAPQVGCSPWYPPYPMYNYPSPFMGMYGWPYWMPYFMPPYPYPMMPYPYGYGGQVPYPAAAPYPCEPYPPVPMPYGAYQGQQQAPAGAARPRKTRPLYTALIIILLLILIGGGVAAAVLLTGSTSASYRLGDSSVTGADIEFRGMLLSQKGNVLTLSGTYDNNTKYEGEVVVTVQALTGGNEQPIIFTVPVVPGTGKSFSQQKSAESLKLSGATLSSLVYTGNTGGSSGTGSNSSGTSSYPFNQTSPSQSTSPSSGSYPYNQYQQSSPNSNIP